MTRDGRQNDTPLLLGKIISLQVLIPTCFAPDGPLPALVSTPLSQLPTMPAWHEVVRNKQLQ